MDYVDRNYRVWPNQRATLKLIDFTTCLIVQYLWKACFLNYQ